MAPPPAPADAFAALSSSGAAKPGPAKKSGGVPVEVLSDFKQAILQNARVSRLGIIEVLSSQFPRCTKNQIKTSLDAVAEVNGRGRSRLWVLKESPAST
jgi:chromatin assembly factor 1 subunit A